MNKRRKISKRDLKEILGSSLYILFTLGLAIFIVTFVGQRTTVVGQSMEYTLMNGDNLIVDKISYRLHEPERFDVVVFPYRYDRKMKFIKRVIGLPGETVQILNDGSILINGELLEEFYGKEVIADPGRATETILLSDDEYFVLGDNRNNSKDSRFEDVGNVKRDEIIGRAWYRIFPFNEFGRID